MSAIGTCYPVWLRRLREAGIDAAGFELDLMLEEGLSLSKAQRLSHPEQEIGPENIAQIQQWISRREQGEPLQYLLGWWEFYGRRFSVGPGVLIPRADTEILVEQALKELEHVPAPRIADLCAGSGCVGLTIACERPTAQVSLLELSPDAFDYCARNVKALAPGCRLIRADVLRTTAGLTGLDAVLSNPPYIPTSVIHSLAEEVKLHEPLMALDGKEDGLWFYREIVRKGPEYLKRGGRLFFEIGYDQGEAVRSLMEEAGFTEVTVKKDLAGLDRVVFGRYYILDDSVSK